MIILDKPIPTGSTARFHKVARFEISNDGAIAVVNSYATATCELVAWVDTYVLGGEVAVGTISDVETILSRVGAPFAGGEVVADVEADDHAKRLRKWALVKVERDTRASATFTFDNHTFQIDPVSLARLASVARLLDDANPTIEWTLADNTTATLTASDVDAVLAAITRYITALHAVSQTARSLIFDNENEIEDYDIGMIMWPDAIATL